MDNLKKPAYPSHIILDEKDNVFVTSDDLGKGGFTKLEMASLMIAQGGVGNIGNDLNSEWIPNFAYLCTLLAKAVLEEANK